MLWRKRYKRRIVVPVAGILLALFWVELTADLVNFNFIPSVFTPVEAASTTIDPDGDVITNTGTQVTCTGAATYEECLDEAVRDPTAPSTTGDYIDYSDGDQTNSTVGTFPSVDTATSIDVKVYHQETGSGMILSVSLWDATGTTQYGITQALANQGTPVWDTSTFSALSLGQTEIGGLVIRLSCAYIGGPSGVCSGFAMYADVTYSELINVTVSATNTQQNVNASTTDSYIGGAFVIAGTNGSRNVTSITINETGSIDAQNNLKNIKLFYDLSTSTPYDCSSESYAGDENQFSTTVVGGFSGANGSATFSSASVAISPTQTMCVYAVMDVLGVVGAGDTIEVEITNSTSDIGASGSPIISPTTAVTLPGVTTVQKTILEQVNYHWRNDDGDEAGASSATGGVENTSYDTFPKSTTKRLRLAISNEGNKDSDPVQYRLEYATKVTTCIAATGWTDVGGFGGDFDMSNTGNLTDGNDTTDISISTGGVSNPNVTFQTPNGGQRDVNSQTGNITSTSTQFVELEYAIQAAGTVSEGATYCFRATNAGTDLDAYQQYAEATIKLDTDFKIQRGVSTMSTSTITISAGAEYEAPSSSSTAFIRITNTQLTGAGPNTGNGNSNADDVTVYIVNPENITSNITFQRGVSATGNTRIAWEIVEYIGAPGGENEIVVRSHQPLTYATGNTVVSSPTISSVVDNTKVAVFITSQYNPDTGLDNYHLGLSTSAWNTSTTQVDLTRGASGNAAIVTYALIEFTGGNWLTQRIEHVYVTAGATSTEAITAVNSLSRTFLHMQKRTAQNNHADFGHEVWLSGIGQISFLIDATASTPADHTSVAWVIENTQTTGAIMEVTRSKGELASGGTGPETNNISIGKTLDDLTIASLLTNNRSDEATRSWPEPILSARISSSTHYELWRSDATANISYRTEVVEWPTAARKLEQGYYRLYVDNDSLLPTDPWPVGGSDLGENTEITATDTPMTLNDIVRIRMAVSVSASAMPAGLDSFNLQFAERVTTCSAITDWSQVGEVGSTTALWRGINNTPVAGTALSIDPPTGGDLLISLSTVAGTYEEQNSSAVNPHTAFPGDEVEYDWVVQHNGAKDKTSYCFRMTEADSTLFQAYNFHPVLRTVGYEPQLTNWHWYDDEGSITPTTSLANENVAPVDIQNQNLIKLRLVLSERSGATGVDTKFALQFSEYSDFSQAVHVLPEVSDCTATSLWCYADGAGVDNNIIDQSVISDADSCVSGVGDGCGTYNESTSTPSTFDQTAYTNAEYEFTIKHAGARTNAVYYFRLYDVVNDEVVVLNSTSTYPSLVTEGASLTFTVTGLPSGTTTAGIVTDATTTATGISFVSVPFDTEYEVAHRITVNTNATEGYQVLKFATQQLLNSVGEAINPITTTNAAPGGWSTGCIVSESGCFGYHTTDAVLQGGSARFSATDSYAKLNTAAEEIMFSPIPTIDTHDIVYKIRVNEKQSPGNYVSEITYLAIPTF
jgi:hypothetical protein